MIDKATYRMSQKILVNLFVLAITYSLFTLPAHAQIQGTEICSAFDPYIDKTPTIISIDGAAQTIRQVSINEYHSFTLNRLDACNISM